MTQICGQTQRATLTNRINILIAVIGWNKVLLFLQYILNRFNRAKSFHHPEREKRTEPVGGPHRSLGTLHHPITYEIPNVNDMSKR